MPQLIIIRHGETDWNRDAVFRGRVDLPLSARGRDQARLLAAAFSGRPLAALYASPLARARETAAPLAALPQRGQGRGGPPLITDDRFTDMSFGEWEGKPLSEVRDRWPDLYHTWVAEPERFRAPGGESLRDVLDRAWPAVVRIVSQHADAPAAIVSHRVVCKLILCAALGLGEAGFWRLRVDTASVSILARDDAGWTLLRSNDTHHLQPLGEADPADF